MREGDTLVVWKLDRLAASMNLLIETVEGLEAQGIGFRSITEAMNTTTSAGNALSISLCAPLNGHPEGGDVNQLNLFLSDVHLPCIDPAQNKRRIYALSVQRMPLGEWALVRE